MESTSSIRRRRESQQPPDAMPPNSLINRSSEDQPLLPHHSSKTVLPRSSLSFSLPIFALFLLFITITLSPLLTTPHTRPAPPPPPTPGAINIDILTYNTFLRPALVSLLDRQSARLPYLVSSIAPFEIALLQETFWLSFTKPAFLAALRATNTAHYTNAPLPGLSGLLTFPPKLIDGGLTIASKYPIEETSFIPYTSSVWRSIDAIVAKGVLYAKIRLPASTPTPRARGACLHVFTTHAQANNGLAPAVFEAVRADQQLQLVQFVRDTTGSDPEECSVVVAGDFNSDGRISEEDGRSGAEYEGLEERLRLVEPRLVDVLFEEAGHTHPGTNAGGISGAFPKMERLDYIFFGERLGSGAGVVASMTRHPKVVKFLIEGLLPDVRSCSDHFGVQFSLNTKWED